MESGSSDLPDPSHAKTENVTTANAESVGDNSASNASSKVSTSGISSWAKNLKIPQPLAGSQNDSQSGTSTKSTFARFTSGFGLRLSPRSSPTEENSAGTSPTTETAQSGFIGTLTKGIVDSSKSAVKAVQVKARHVVSQNKRRYQEGGFDLDMTYITENIIAMGFPAGDMSSGFFGYVEGFYRNHMEEVIKFFETHHKYALVQPGAAGRKAHLNWKVLPNLVSNMQDKYKVYNLCSERLYDASLFEGKVASFPFDDHNCPPIQLIISFCQSAYSWLKEDIENVVVVHCKAGMARTGLMISSLLLYLKFFPTAEESIDYYNQKRCFDGKALVLPSQIRYVKYFERVLTYFNGENPTGRRCLLRGFRLHRCPYWVRPSITVFNHNGVLFSTKKHPRTKDLSPEDFWFTAPKKGIMVFALPGEPGLTELAGDFKIHFHDRQGDFYCWLNTTMIENRKVLNTSDLDGFDKRKLPSPGFQLEVVLVDYDGAAVPARAQSETAANQSVESPGPVVASGPSPGTVNETAVVSDTKKETGNREKDDVFSDSEAEESVSSKSKRVSSTPKIGESVDKNAVGSAGHSGNSDQAADLAHKTEHMSLGSAGSSVNEPRKDVVDKGTISGLEGSNSVGGVSEFKVLAADASVFTFGDEEDYESE